MNRRKLVAFRPRLLGGYADYERALEQLDEGQVWVVEDLSFVWREAQLEAALAYRHWCRIRDRIAYAGYRAAQDRADAAQKALHARCAAEPARRASTA